MIGDAKVKPLKPADARKVVLVRCFFERVGVGDGKADWVLIDCAANDGDGHPVGRTGGRHSPEGWEFVSAPGERLVSRWTMAGGVRLANVTRQAGLIDTALFDGPERIGDLQYLVAGWYGVTRKTANAAAALLGLTFDEV